MPYQEPDTYNETLTGTPGWRQHQLHDIAQRARETFEKRKVQGPKPYINTVAGRNNLQNAARTSLGRIVDQGKIAGSRYDRSSKNLGNIAQTNTHKTVNPQIQAATRSPFSVEDSELMKHFKGAYGDIGKAVQEEMTENYKKNIAPSVNYAYMTNGLWNSGSRNQHNKDVIKNLHKDIARELTKLKGQGLRESLEHIGQHKERGLHGAQLEANILEKNKEAGILAEKSIQDTERAKLLHNLAVNEQQRSFGAEDQALEEAKLREKSEEDRYLEEFSVKELATEAALANAQPVPIQFARSKAPEPRPVSGSQIAGGTLASIIGQMYPQQQAKKKGGSVKKYAPGGPITVTPPAGTLSPELEQAMALMQENRQNKSNPTGKAFSSLGAHLLSTVGQNPLHSFGQGLEKFHTTQTAHEGENAAENMRQINILKAVHDSRQEQANIIKNFEMKQAELAEQARLHSAQIGMHGAHADLLRAQTEQLSNPSFLGGSGSHSSNYLPKGVKETTSLKERAKQNTKIKERIDAEYEGAKKGIEPAIALLEGIEQTNLGPTSGAISEWGGVFPKVVEFFGGGKPEHQSQITGSASDLVAAKQASLGSKATVASQQNFERSKASVRTPKEEAKRRTSKDLNELWHNYGKAKFINEFVDAGKGDYVDALKAFSESHPNIAEAPIADLKKKFSKMPQEGRKGKTKEESSGLPSPDEAAEELARRRGQ